MVYLNGSVIHEDDKMSMNQWVYPFQVGPHLVQVSAAGGARGLLPARG